MNQIQAIRDRSLWAATPRTRGYIMAFVGTTLWANTAILGGYLMRHYTIGPLGVAFWRNLVVAITLVGLLAVWRPAELRLNRADFRFFMIGGAIGIGLSNAVFFYSVQLNGAAVATVIVFIAPALVAIGARFLFDEPLTRIKLISLGLSLVGCVLVSDVLNLARPFFNPAGILVGLLSGVTFAAYSLFGKRAIAHNDPWKTTAYFFVFGTALLFFMQPPDQFFSMGAELPAWALLIVLGAGPTLGGYALYTASLRDLPASVASLVSSLEPALTALLAFLFLGERMSLIQIMGGAMVVGAVALLSWD